MQRSKHIAPVPRELAETGTLPREPDILQLAWFREGGDVEMLQLTFDEYHSLKSDLAKMRQQ